MSGKIQLKTIDNLMKEAEKQLRPKKITCEADRQLGWLEAEILMAHAIKKERAWIIAHGNDALTPSLEKRFWEFVKRRKMHEPVAYILGAKDFFGRPFFVNKMTLIPRPETELMIATLKKNYTQNDRLIIWDVGTGSGAIAITVALEFPNATIIASDTCKRALRVAEKNAKLYSVEHRISFIHGSLLTPEIHKKIQNLDNSRAQRPAPSALVILANLPYLPESDKAKLAKDVTNFEPAKALYAGTDGLDLIRSLFAQISNDLNVNPDLILAEFDPPQAKMILKTAKEIFPIASVVIHKDMAKRERLLEITS